MKKIKAFNLKKSQQAMPLMDPMGLNDAPEIQGDRAEDIQNVQQGQRFKDAAELRDFLMVYSQDNNWFNQVWPELQSENPASEEGAQSALKNFYSGLEIKDPQTQLTESEQIYNFIYGNQGGIQMQAPYGSPSELNAISNDIKKLAEETIKNKKAKSFNMKKFAQHKSFENSIMYGPSQTRIDPFYRMPVSDWHIVERNKGFGQDIGGIWDIDYEVLWRENIMDKYSRPYRDKEGNWVGGYINKRFEVDRNIPEASNYQLKPGQRRKARPAEYGVIEARLQDARSKGEIEGGPVVNKTKPFNWKEANSKKKT